MQKVSLSCLAKDETKKKYHACFTDMENDIVENYAHEK